MASYIYRLVFVGGVICMMNFIFIWSDQMNQNVWWQSWPKPSLFVFTWRHHVTNLLSLMDFLHHFQCCQVEMGAKDWDGTNLAELDQSTCNYFDISSLIDESIISIGRMRKEERRLSISPFRQIKFPTWSTGVDLLFHFPTERKSKIISVPKFPRSSLHGPVDTSQYEACDYSQRNSK